MAAARQVQIEVTGKVDQYESALKTAEAKTRETLKKIDSSSSAGGGGGWSFSAGEGLGKLAKGVVTLEAAAAGMKVLNGLVAAAKGDWSAVEGYVRSIPFGVGSIIGGVVDLKRQLDGTVEAQRALEESAKRYAENLQKVNQAAQAVNSYTQAGSKSQSAMERDRAVSAGGAEAGVQFDYATRVDEIRRQAQKLREQVVKTIANQAANGMSPDMAGFRVANQEIDVSEARQLAEARGQRDRGINDAQSQATLDAVRNRQTELDAEKQHAERKLEESKRYAQRLRDIEAETAIMRDEMAGRQYSADIRKIDQKYQQMLEKAEGGEKALLMTQRLAEYDRASMAESERQKSRDDAVAKQRQTILERGKSELESNLSIIASQRLDPSDAGMLTRGLGNDRSEEIADMTARNTEETARLLREMVQEQKNQRINRSTQTVGFN